MHRCLHIQELVLNILHHLSFKADIYHFGVTCWDIWNVAEDELWGDAVTDRMLRCLMPERREQVRALAVTKAGS